MLPWELHQYQLSQLTPKLRYNGELPFGQWQQEAREKLRALLGMDTFTLCDPAFEAQPIEDMGSYTRMRFSFRSEEHYRVPCYWLEPKEITHPGVMICLQGHSTGMHISLGDVKFEPDSTDGDRGFALQAVERGMRAIVLEQRNFGEMGSRPDGSPDCYMPAMTALLLGRTVIAERVWDVVRVIDVAIDHLIGDTPAEFYCMGNSGGGTATTYAACLEPRIAKTMPSCSLCSYDGSIAPMHHCACNYVPGIRRWFDMGDLAGLIAPRPLTVVAGAQDRIFPEQPTRETFALIQSYYAAAGAPDNCALYMGAEGHRFYAEAWDQFIMLNA